MKIYTVGGAVRDRLLGLEVQDRDFVVVGASPQQMLNAGFRPVGRDFPVFLHPDTHEEYALARTERKVAPGYAGFTFQSSTDVTLEQDLQRRDLTINAIAQAEDGALVDPWGGQADLRAKVFRHVSDAFAEDPVRILRVARFSARFPDFTVAPETMELMKSMVAAGEVDALVPERIWQELARGLMQVKPSRLFEVLVESGALARIAPEFHGHDVRHNEGDASIAAGRSFAKARWMSLLDQAAGVAASLPVRFSLWAQALNEHTGAAVPLETEGRADLLMALCQRLRVPSECRTLAMLSYKESRALAQAYRASPDELLRLLTQADAFRKPERFEELLQLVRLIFAGEELPVEESVTCLRRCLVLANRVDSAKIAQAINANNSSGPAGRGEAIKRAVEAARLQAIQAELMTRPPGRVASDSGLPTGALTSIPKRRLWKRLIRAPFTILAALLLGFIDWLWNPLLALVMRLHRFRLVRAIEAAISNLPPYAALFVFAVPVLMLLPFKIFGLYLITHGQKLAGSAVFVLAKVIGTATIARIFSLTSPALMSMPWFGRLYHWFKAFKAQVYELVFDHPWIRLVRRLARRRINQLRRLMQHIRQRIASGR